MTSSPATCAHRACRCTRPYSKQTQAASTAPLDPQAEFCSRRCEEEAGGAGGDDGCECGHPQCSASASAGVPPMQ